MRRRIASLLVLALGMGACSQYRLATLEDLDSVPIPNYTPRVVPVPENCDGLIQRAATQGMQTLTEAQAREVLFCQQQMIIRTQEEEAAAKRLESHAAAARFALQTLTLLVTGTVAVLAWIF